MKNAVMAHLYKEDPTRRRKGQIVLKNDDVWLLFWPFMIKTILYIILYVFDIVYSAAEILKMLIICKHWQK